MCLWQMRKLIFNFKNHFVYLEYAKDVGISVMKKYMPNKSTWKLVSIRFVHIGVVMGYKCGSIPSTHISQKKKNF